MGSLHQNHAYSPRRRGGESTSSAMPDSAFEPQSGFTFDDETAPDAEEFSNMQRNINSLNILNNNGAGFQPMDGIPVHDMGENFPSGFVNPFLFDQSNTPNSPSWHGMQPDMQSQSFQEDIVNGRGPSVARHYGQITPPDDSTPKNFSAVPRLQHPTPPVQSIPNAKSERARNAANQRHAKAKKARKDSGRSVDSLDEDGDEVEDKREKYREKNRLAAAKCRAKKKVNTEDLEVTAREATARNARLKAEERELRDLFSSLRDQALAHDPTQGCNCQAIHQYNRHKAQETARGVMTGFGIPSPSQHSIDAASPVTMGSSRGNSFSGNRPQTVKHSAARSQSLANPMAFAPSSTAGDMRQSFATVGDSDVFPEYLQRSSDGQHVNYS